MLDETELVLIGSDLVIMQEAGMTFPGRRGIADEADFHVYPLTVFLRKLRAAPKKAKKVLFADPFIFHAMTYWIEHDQEPFESQIIPCVSDPQRASSLVETVVVNHIRRQFETFYIKANGDVDVAYINANTFWPIELKWTQQL